MSYLFKEEVESVLTRGDFDSYFEVVDNQHPTYSKGALPKENLFGNADHLG